MENQPLINIGCLGSVSDGKSTLIEKLTGIKTQRHSSEKIRNITIKQGYGNMKIWKYNNKFYTSSSSATKDSIKSLYSSDVADTDVELINHISFVDCPGHHELTHTMLSSINLMNGAIVVIAVDKPINKKPQLIQHLIAAKMGKINKFIICMNKIDLISKNLLYIRKKELDELLLSLNINAFVIIPTCFNKQIGLDYIVTAMVQLFTIEHVSNNTEPLFKISRTFDINKPGTPFYNVKGGILGGTLSQGKLHVNDEIIIQPNNYKTKIIEIRTEDKILSEAAPGGLIALQTDLDPYYCKNDNLRGNICGIELPNTTTTVMISDITFCDKHNILKLNEKIKVQLYTNIYSGKIIQLNPLHITFDTNVCFFNNENIILCDTVNELLKIIGNGFIISI